MTKYHDKIKEKISTVDVVKDQRFIAIRNTENEELTEEDIHEMKSHSVCYSLTNKQKFTGNTKAEVLNKIQNNQPDMLVSKGIDNEETSRSIN